MHTIRICDECLEAYEPEEVNGIRMLKIFKGYTVDLRLKQFRKANSGEELEFIEFESKKGRTLLQDMHLKYCTKGK